MAQKTELSVIGVPGRIHSFSAKEWAGIDITNTVSRTVYFQETKSRTARFQETRSKVVPFGDEVTRKVYF